MPDGKYLVWLILLSSWGCDTFAYCAGKLFGKHKMTPKLSPKKTVEGAIGGVVGAAVLGFLYGTFFKNNMIQVINPGVISGAACAIAAVISMVGDLAASAIKRNHDIKDYGNLIPGHGGILDRFDSMIFTAPAIYFAIMFMGIRWSVPRMDERADEECPGGGRLKASELVHGSEDHHRQFHHGQQRSRGHGGEMAF